MQYGMCSSFKRYELDIVLLKKTTLRYGIDKEDHVISEDFLFPATICAVAASETSQDSVWFIKIDSEEQEALELLTDNYGHCISSSQKYVAGKYLEKVGSKKQCQTYKLMKKNVYFFKDNIIYLFVNFQVRKDVYSVSDFEYCEVIEYAEHIHILWSCHNI